MKALDVHFMIKELQSLIGAKVDKIYQKENELIISLHKQGKKLLKVTPEAIYITKYKFEQERPPSFCMYLRKHLNQARITEIIQRGFERIVEIRLKKEKEHVLVIELFSKGNIILCQSNLTIMLPLHEQEWKARKIKRKVTYTYPPHLKYNPLIAADKDLEKLGKENLVKTLAMDFGLGGSYAEEACLRAGVNKHKKKLSKEEIKKVIRIIKHLREEVLKPNKVDDEVYSFELKIHKGKKKKFYKTLSEALDEHYKEAVIEEKAFQKRKKKIQQLLEKQKKTFRRAEKNSRRSQDKR